VKSEDVDDTRMTLVNALASGSSTFLATPAQSRKARTLSVLLSLAFRRFEGLVAIGSRMAARDGKSAERKVRMCAQLNRHSPLPRLRCWPVSEKKDQGKIKSKSFRLNDSVNRWFLPTPSGTSSSWFKTETGGNTSGPVRHACLRRLRQGRTL
jgi:hypothetical protein